ncbi:hypothetical protein GF325_06980 [Candidatus Bathyarchaeota archaeon]|nr:hypothetical protein [Candidatus Bathyarchaeota archaeon]
MSVMEPGLQRVMGADAKISIPDSGDVLDAIAALDEKYFKKTVKAKRGNTIIQSIMHLAWNAACNAFHDDLGVQARSNNGTWLPIRENPFMEIPTGSRVTLIPDAGC